MAGGECVTSGEWVVAGGRQVVRGKWWVAGGGEIGLRFAHQVMKSRSLGIHCRRGVACKSRRVKCRDRPITGFIRLVDEVHRGEGVGGRRRGRHPLSAAAART